MTLQTTYAGKFTDVDPQSNVKINCFNLVYCYCNVVLYLYDVNLIALMMMMMMTMSNYRDTINRLYVLI